MKLHQPEDYDTCADRSRATEFWAWTIIAAVVVIVVLGIYV